MRRWEDDPWPGNVRQLRNAIARRIALGDLADATSQPAEGPLESPPTADALDSLDHFVELGVPLPQARDRILEEFEQRYVSRVLAAHGGDVGKAAAASGIGRRYFQKLKARHR